MSSLKDAVKELLAEDLSHEKEVVANVKSELKEDGVEVSDADLCAVFFKMRRNSRGPRPEGSAPRRNYVADPNNQRFFINIGSVDGLNRDELIKLVSSNVAGISAGDFKDVYIKDRFSFFEVGKEHTDDVIANLKDQSYGDREVHVELSNRK